MCDQVKTQLHATIHHDSSRCDLHCQLGMDKTENSEITKVPHDVPTVFLPIHYDS